MVPWHKRRIIKRRIEEKDKLKDELKDELLDMVHDTIGNMQPPNAFDHIVGALSGPLQMWAMRKAGIDPATGQALQTILPDLEEAFQSQDL